MLLRTSQQWRACQAAATVGLVLCVAAVRAGEPTPVTDPAVTPASAATTSAPPTALYRQLLNRRGGDAAAIAQAVQLSAGLPPEEAATLYEALAEAHLKAHSLDMAIDVRRALVANLPQTAAAHSALLSLVRTYASSEVSLVQRKRAGSEGAAASDGSTFAAYAVQLAENAASTREEWRDDPALSFQRGVALRRLGQADAARALFGAAKRSGRENPWRECSLAEEWLAEGRQGDSPKPLLACHRAEVAPHLDGVLDEACWQGTPVQLAAPHMRVAGVGVLAAPSEQLSSAGDSRTRPQPPEHVTSIRLAYDNEALYLAIEAPKFVPASFLTGRSNGRKRDADLSEHDRLRLRLDVDRDYATWFELTVDNRGWPADRCGEDASWNPKWYIATSQAPADGAAGEPRWIVEAAIPFSELAARPPAAGEAWAATLERLIPQAPAQSWLPPAGDSPQPANFGLVLFD